MQLFARVSPCQTPQSDYYVELTFATFFLFPATQLNSPRTRSAPPQELFAQRLRQSRAGWVVVAGGVSETGNLTAVVETVYSVCLQLKLVIVNRPLVSGLLICG